MRSPSGRSTAISTRSARGGAGYGEPGPGGGFALLDSYRTNLTGLTEGEVRALFMLNIPRPLADLGVGRELGAALRKLAAALPSARRDDEQRVRQRFLLDAVGWEQVEESAPHLATVHRAVWEDRRLHLAYRIHPLAVLVEQTVDPYGLVAKGGDWHLVYAVASAGGGLRLRGRSASSVWPCCSMHGWPVRRSRGPRTSTWRPSGGSGAPRGM